MADSEQTGRHRLATNDEIVRRLSKQSDATALLGREVGDIKERLTDIAGKSGRNGQIGLLHGKVDGLDEKVTDGFVEIAKRLQAQDIAAASRKVESDGKFVEVEKLLEQQSKGGASALRWTVAVIVVPLIIAAVALYQRLAVLETLVKVVR